jgi:hypothetical protein
METLFGVLIGVLSGSLLTASLLIFRDRNVEQDTDKYPVTQGSHWMTSVYGRIQIMMVEGDNLFLSSDGGVQSLTRKDFILMRPKILLHKDLPMIESTMKVVKELSFSE